MDHTWMQITWFFFIYSFIGWLVDVSIAAIYNRKFVNRGFNNIPLCPLYGFMSVINTIFLTELSHRLFFLFLSGALLATLLEYITGHLMEKIFHKKLWDYSHLKWNLGGYISARNSMIWGILTIIMIRLTNPLISALVGFIPRIIAIIILCTLSGLLILDFLTTNVAVMGMIKQAKRLTQLTEEIQKSSKLLENALTSKIQSRMMKSFPSISMEALVHEPKKKSTVFAEGCSFYKLVSLFFIGAFLGDIVETIFCLLTTGILMSRSSVIYGPFSIVWGLACFLLTLLLYPYKDKSDRFIFMAGAVLGGAYEYICSVFTELAFGTVFWDYSGFTFNLGGRINLLYCFFWGFAAVVWLKFLYPRLSAALEKIPKRFGIIFFNFMMVFMICNILISSFALARYSQRNTVTETQVTGTESKLVTTINDFLDTNYDDERMIRIYPNIKIVENMLTNNDID